MRRADRLFRIVQELRRKPVVTAAELGETLEVSERTIYRDIQDLSASGVPIAAEAGIGYSLARGFDLPPLMFDADEVEALVLGARMVQRWGDPALVRAAENALAKVESVLPSHLKERLEKSALFAVSFELPERFNALLAPARQAVSERRRLRLSYTDAAGAVTDRVIRPLGLYFWGRVWTLGGWCELRVDHRLFRIDRIEALEILDDRFELVPPVTLDDFLEAVRG